jgi:hypothetical protein
MAKKINSKITKIKERFGAFEVRISDDKVEIEDYTYKLRKFVFSNATIEYNMLLSFLSDVEQTESGFARKSEEAAAEDRKRAEFMVYLLGTTQLLFSNAKLRGVYIDSVMKTLGDVPVPESDETEQEILDNLKSEHEAKELLKDVSTSTDYEN